MKPSLTTLMICVAALATAQAQTTDTADGAERSQAYDEQSARSLESERERLGNQRIRTETEIRARAEQRRLEEAELARLRAQEDALNSEEAIAPRSEHKPTEAGSKADLSRTLEQLRSLGELKDDGYITDEEFQKIKKKILDSQI
ncbi:MAG: SHOCT domain-containing protein [Gammaproteobacteria bacterium]|nr:SHOCT domain-containing protein [Gammaproteobacteria bacterium]MBT8111781.1 SHOCT domain-containing protein [Gammaproteobacteria bacterium]NND47179.1 hypothetical protein [Woeseiaceae bacterium]NNL46480.1 hypothetical protein [Woeseiaceae bacterium]